MEDGRRKCPHCNTVQPPNKLGFIRHVAMEHEEVTEELAREFMEKMTKEKEETQTEEVGGKSINDDNTEEETGASTIQADVKKDQDGPAPDMNNEKENVIMECDPMIEVKKWFFTVMYFVKTCMSILKNLVHLLE